MLAPDPSTNSRNLKTQQSISQQKKTEKKILLHHRFKLERASCSYEQSQTQKLLLYCQKALSDKVDTVLLSWTVSLARKLWLIVFSMITWHRCDKLPSLVFCLTVHESDTSKKTLTNCYWLNSMSADCVNFYWPCHSYSINNFLRNKVDLVEIRIALKPKRTRFISYFKGSFVVKEKLWFSCINANKFLLNDNISFSTLSSRRKSLSRAKARWQSLKCDSLF